MKISIRILTFLWVLLTCMLVTICAQTTPPAVPVPVPTASADRGSLNKTTEEPPHTTDFTTFPNWPSTDDSSTPLGVPGLTTKPSTIAKTSQKQSTTPEQSPTTTIKITTETTPSLVTTPFTTPTQSTLPAIVVASTTESRKITHTQTKAPPEMTSTKAPPKHLTVSHGDSSTKEAATPNSTKKDSGFLPGIDKDSFTAKVLLPIAAGIVLAVFIVLIACSVRSCLEKDGQSSTRKRFMDHEMGPTDRVMLLADSSEDEF